MPGLEPGIRRLWCRLQEDVDGRDKPGHDEFANSLFDAAPSSDARASPDGAAASGGRATSPRRRAEPLVFRLCFSASIRLTTLSGFSSRSGTSMVLPDALRRTSFFSASSYSSLNFFGIEMRRLGIEDVAGELDHVL